MEALTTACFQERQGGKRGEKRDKQARKRGKKQAGRARDQQREM
jgi:hypothetical protein